MILKFCTGFLHGSEGCVKKFMRFCSFLLELQGKRGLLGWDLVSARSRTFKFYHSETFSNGMILKFCTSFLYGSEGCVKKFCAISSIWAQVMGEKGGFWGKFPKTWEIIIIIIIFVLCLFSMLAWVRQFVYT